MERINTVQSADERCKLSQQQSGIQSAKIRTFAENFAKSKQMLGAKNRLAAISLLQND